MVLLTIKILISFLPKSPAKSDAKVFPIAKGVLPVQKERTRKGKGARTVLGFNRRVVGGELVLGLRIKGFPFVLKKGIPCGSYGNSTSRSEG